jgi:hypothetical protein
MVSGGLCQNWRYSGEIDDVEPLSVGDTAAINLINRANRS